MSKLRQDLKANLRLYRNTEGPVCVPSACRDDETAQTTQTLAFEKEWWARQDSTRTVADTVIDRTGQPAWQIILEPTSIVRDFCQSLLLAKTER